jgi:flavodoxin I
MRTLVVYDSLYGNTERIARAIGSGISGDVEVLRVSEVGSAVLRPFDLLVVGCPTQNSTATKAILRFVEGIPSQALKAARVATFDTRYQSFLATLLGSGASKIADAIKKGGGPLVTPPEGFIVRGKRGPLKEGEVERASTWAKGLATAGDHLAASPRA